MARGIGRGWQAWQLLARLNEQRTNYDDHHSPTQCTSSSARKGDGLVSSESHDRMITAATRLHQRHAYDVQAAILGTRCALS